MKNQKARVNIDKDLILIIYDHIAASTQICSIVRDYGFRVETTVNNKNSIKKAKVLRPALILLDLVGAFGTLRLLQSEGLSEIPVILVSEIPIERLTVTLAKQEQNVKGLIHAPVKRKALAALLHELSKAPVFKADCQPLCGE